MNRNFPREVASMYLHFPFCRHLCNYCDFYKTLAPDGKPQLTQFHNYLNSSFSELNRLMELNNFKFIPLKTFYIGGGTPSLWDCEGAYFIKEFLQKNQISFQPEYEFTLEVNPGCWTFAGIKEWRNVGVNRFSIGLQALNAEYLSYLDRYHSIEDSLRTLDFFQKQGINYSVDFMLGLPHSEKRDRNIISELQEVLKYRPNHISLYILTTKGHYPLKEFLPEDDFLSTEYAVVAQYLRERGFLHYEVSNFAKEGYESKHNLQYWKFESVAALGKSATGLLVESWEKAFRFKWKVNSPEYEQEILSQNEINLERFYLRLRTNLGINPEEFFAPKDLPRFSQLTDQWRNFKYLEKEENHIKLTAKGYLMLDSLMGDVFRDLKSL